MNISSPLPASRPLSNNPSSSSTPAVSHPPTFIPPSLQSSLSPSPVNYITANSLRKWNNPFGISFISTLLGGVFFTSSTLVIVTLIKSYLHGPETIGQGMGYGVLTPQLGIYLAAWAAFHLAEFWVTAVWNGGKLSVDAFLLNNGANYHIAHMFGLLEYFIRLSLSSHSAPLSSASISPENDTTLAQVQALIDQLGSTQQGATPSFEQAVEGARVLGGLISAMKGLGGGAVINGVGRVNMGGWYAESCWLGGWWGRWGWWGIALPLLIISQLLRSLAMIHAAQSFSHVVSRKKRDDHVLVTRGVYRFSRHPSYTGFFYWAIATQLLLGNLVSTVGFAFVLGKFFGDRIRDEETHLVKFFGNDYVEYRKRVGTWLPWGLVRTGSRVRKFAGSATNGEKVEKRD